MGRKVHPYGFRVGDHEGLAVAGGSASASYAEQLVHEDLRLRRLVLRDAARCRHQPRSLIDRNANQVTMTVQTAKPGIVIGRGGQNVERAAQLALQKATDRRVRLNIEEIRVPELDAQLVARSVADQLERRVAFRRAMKQAVQRTMQRGALGCRVPHQRPPRRFGDVARRSRRCRAACRCTRCARTSITGSPRRTRRSASSA